MSYVKLTTQSDLPAEGEAKEFEIEGRTICVANVGGTISGNSFNAQGETSTCKASPNVIGTSNTVTNPGKGASTIPETPGV